MQLLHSYRLDYTQVLDTTRTRGYANAHARDAGQICLRAFKRFTKVKKNIKYKMKIAYHNKIISPLFYAITI